jgi:dihydroorotase
MNAMSSPINGEQPASEVFDIVVKGGRILDPCEGLDTNADIGIRYGRIASIGRDLAVHRDRHYLAETGTQVVDATGKLVVPGFIDLHTHPFTGVCPIAIPADAFASRSGVTTMVSAGDAGAHSIDGFRHLVVDRSRTRILAFLNVSRVGLLAWPSGEAIELEACDTTLAIRAIEQNRDFVVGVKVRESIETVGSNGLEPLDRALRVGEETGVPVMCHIGNSPGPLTAILDRLRPGDILTHCFTGAPNNIIHNGRMVDGARDAHERGVVFDIGHGIGSFDFRVAERACEAGLLPTTVSTDANSLSATHSMKDLPMTINKVLALGLTLPQAIRSVACAPAQVLGRGHELGAIRTGAAADLTILDVVEEPVELRDQYGNTRVGGMSVAVRSTIRGGVPWDGPYAHPGRSFFGSIGGH